jgi:plastocyanin
LNADRTHLALPPSLSSGSIASSDLPIADPIIFGEGFGGISNLVVGPDGNLYVISFGNGSIYRITKADNVSSFESLLYRNTSTGLKENHIVNKTSITTARAETHLGEKKVIHVSIRQDASDLGNKAFNPDIAIIKRGDTIEWINNDSQIHNVVEGYPSIPSEVSAIRPEASDSESGFESTMMAQEMTFRHIFDKQGTFKYYCSIHPTMTGTVIVSAS